MAMKLYGSVEADNKAAKTQGGRDGIEVWAQTEFGRINVILTSDGDFSVAMYPVKNLGVTGDGVRLATGNVNSQTTEEQTARDNDADQKYDQFTYSSAWNAEDDDAN
jgi:hypothetical protein